MANTFITTDLVAKTALAEFANNAPLIMTGSRIYQDSFTNSGFKIGDTLRIPRQNSYVVGNGSTATPQDIINTVENLVIENQYHVFIEYTIQDLALRIEDFNRQFLQPAIQNIVSKMELDIFSKAETQINSFVGTPGTPINSFAAVDQAGVKLLQLGVPLNREAYMVLGLQDASSLKSGLQTNFTPVINEEIVRESQIGHISYFDAFQSQNVKRHIAGNGPVLHPGDSLTVNGAVGSGNTIVLAGATASVTNYFVPGDLITISGVQSVNPLSHQATGSNMQFVITAAANSSGGGAVTITVAPAIISSGPQANVSNAIPNGATVTMVGSHNFGLAYIRRSFDIACPPLYKLQTPYSATATDPETGLSFSVVQTGDVTAYQNQMRIDLLNGFTWHQQYAVKVLS
jgi:hypothetical protein